jgi:hypothetical protein
MFSSALFPTFLVRQQEAPRSRGRFRSKRGCLERATYRCRFEQLEDRVVPSTLLADKTIYAPGETAVLHLSGLATGETAAIQVIRTDSGTGTTQVSPTWLVTDGGTGDFDGVVDGQITLYYRVPRDVTLASFQITATGSLSRSTAQAVIQGDSSLQDLLESEPAPPQTTTSLNSSAIPAASGQAVTFTATVTSDSVVNSGDVQFLVDGFDFGSPVPVVGGQATSGSINSLTVGGHTITAAFQDDSASFDSSEATLTLPVNGAATGYTVAWVDIQPHDVAPGQFASVQAGAFQVGETVDFRVQNLTNGSSYAPFSVMDGSSNDLDGVTDGHVQTVWQVPADALNCVLQITATGETSGLTAQNTFTDAQLTTTTTLVSSANTSTYGRAVTFTATVTASSTVNTGSVTFVDGANTLATVNVNATGKATFATTALSAGTHTITAKYTDGTSFTNSSGSVTQQVNPFALWVTANSTSKAEGNTLAFGGTEFTLAGAAGVRRPVLFNGDTLTSVTLTSIGAAAAAEDGSYPIVTSAAVGTGLSNYAITYVPGTLTVLEPTIAVASTPLTAINEGDPSATVEVATFTHANGVEPAGNFSATVDWGIAGHHADAGTISQDSSGTYHVTALRPVFAAGSYTPTVTVRDNNAGANIGQNFAGLSANDDIAVFGGFFVPPDQGSAVGPNHYVEMINLIYAVYNKDGSVAVPRMALSTFYANAGVTGLGTAISDPRIIYDPASGRWFAVIITTEAFNNSIVVAVSQTSDPTGVWKGTRFVANTLANNFADYPTIAIDANALYIASNNFLNLATFDGVSLTSIPKSDLLNPAGPVVSNRSHFENIVGGSSPGTQPTTLAPVSAFDGRDHGVVIATDAFNAATVLHSYSVLNPASNASTFTADIPITVPTYWNNQNAHEPDGSRTLDRTNFRIGQNNVYQVGNIVWAAQSILTSSATGNSVYDAIRWYEIDETTNTLLQSGTISDPHHDYIFPAIAANAAGDVVISFSATGDSTTSDYPGAWYVTGTTTFGVTTFGAPTPLRNGSSNYSIGPPANRNRWGDFSAISIDPNNSNAFWIANEAAIPGDPARTSRTQVWGTQISELVFGNSATATSSLTVNNVAPSVQITQPALSDQAFAINTPVSFAGSFTDPGSTLGETYTATWTFDTATEVGIVSGTNVTATRTFTATGIYNLTLTVTDSNGASGLANTDVNGITMRVVIFDPNAGFVTGGGTIDVAAGSLGPGSTVAGRANFGFVSQYKSGSSVPTGETEFQFQAGNINFHSTSYDWLTINAVVNDGWSQYQGTGTINGLTPAITADIFKFYVASEDNQRNGGTGVDKIRVKIWEQNSSTGAMVMVIFDNQFGATDTAGEPGIVPFVDLTTTLTGGNIALHKLNGAQAEGTAPAGSGATPVLTAQQLAPIVQQAIAAWSAAGISAEQIKALRSIPVYLTDLPGAFVGMSSPDGIWIDRDAAGFGWFVDSTPADNSEFSGRLSGSKFVAAPGSPAYGRVDLLTILVHEMGRPLGLQESPSAPGVMAMQFHTGERVLPVASDLGGSQDRRINPLAGPALINLAIPLSAGETARLVAAAHAETLPIADGLRTRQSATDPLITALRLTEGFSRLAGARAVSQVFTDLDGLRLADDLVDAAVLRGRS